MTVLQIDLTKSATALPLIVKRLIQAFKINW